MIRSDSEIRKDRKGAMEFFGEGEPVGAPLALSAPFDELLRQQLLDVVVGPLSAQIHEIRLEDSFLKGNGCEGSQRCCGEIHRQQIFHQIAHAWS